MNDLLLNFRSNPNIEKLGTIDHYHPLYLLTPYTYTKKVLYIPSTALGSRDHGENFELL